MNRPIQNDFLGQLPTLSDDVNAVFSSKRGIRVVLWTSFALTPADINRLLTIHAAKSAYLPGVSPASRVERRDVHR